MTLKKTVALGGRLVVSVGGLAFLVWKIEDSSHGKNGSVLPGWTSKTALWLVLAFVLTFVSMVIAAQRWRAVLRALDVENPPSLRRLLSIYLSGFFVGNVLPSTVGGDVLRVTRLSGDLGGETPASFASVVLERFTGWLVLPVLILVGFGINRGFFQYGHARSIALIIALVTLVGLGIVWLALSHPRIGGRMGRADGWRRFAGAVHYGADRIQRHPVALVSVIGWGFAYQLVVVLAGFSAARTLGVPAIGPTAMLTFYPAVLIAQVLPISISGLGVREGLFVVFLHPLGVPTGKAVALGILIYLLTLVVSLLGAPGFALGARRPAGNHSDEHGERAVVAQ
jgi:uncharacterized membrane protein YbhN (UPF0104 family)